jgi:hypothetical protein
MIGQIALGLLASNLTEWVTHRYILHGLGRDRDNYWSFHWHDHHRAARRQAFHDDAYHRSVFEPGGKSKEALGLLGLAAAVAPLYGRWPAFVWTTWACGAAYYAIHRQSHIDPAWGRTWVPWHWDHHMGRNQDANWCVTWPLMDHLLGTRIPYAGTADEAEDQARLAARRAARQARAGSVGQRDEAPFGVPWPHGGDGEVAHAELA